MEIKVNGIIIKQVVGLNCLGSLIDRDGGSEGKITRILGIAKTAF